jgi:hypothetical protein
MNTLRKKFTAIGLAGTLGLGALAIPSAPASAAPVAPSQTTIKQAVPQQTEDVRWRRGRWVGPAVALGAVGAIIAHQQYRRYHRNHYYDPYYRPAYSGYYGYRPYPTYYNGDPLNPHLHYRGY